MDIHTEAARLLHRAAQRIERYGWTQGAWRDASRNDAWLAPSDILTAIDLAAGFDPVRHIGRRPDIAIAARAHLHTYLCARGEPLDHPSGIAAWNDEPARTPADITAALRAAAGLAWEAAA